VAVAVAEEVVTGTSALLLAVVVQVVGVEVAVTADKAEVDLAVEVMAEEDTEEVHPSVDLPQPRVPPRGGKRVSIRVKLLCGPQLLT